MGIRDRYRKALEDAGPNFESENPGQHFFFDDQGITSCVFCGHPDHEESPPCPGDVRRMRERLNPGS